MNEELQLFVKCPKSKDLRFWSNDYRFRVGHAPSSTDIQIIKK